MAGSFVTEDADKDARNHVRSENIPHWVSEWAAFVNKLHGRTFNIRCNECEEWTEISRDNVDEAGVHFQCGCPAYSPPIAPEEMVRILDDLGVSLE